MGIQPKLANDRKSFTFEPLYTSKIFIGKGILRLQAMVLRRPGSRDVRATFEQAQKQQNLE